MLTISTGRRPTRSLSRPQNGAASIEASENTAISTVTSCGEAWNCTA